MSATGRMELYISQQVVAAIARATVAEFPRFVLTHRGRSPLAGLIDQFDRQANGIKVREENDEIAVSLYVIVLYGQPIHQQSRALQRRVKTHIEEMTHLKVTQVDIFVRGIRLLSRQKKPEGGGRRWEAYNTKMQLPLKNGMLAGPRIVT